MDIAVAIQLMLMFGGLVATIIIGIIGIVIQLTKK